MPQKCPTLQNIPAASDCPEDFAGLGSAVRVFNKADLKAPLARVCNTDTKLTDAFKAGANIYKFECKEGSQGLVGASQGRRAGFKQTLTCVVWAVNADLSTLNSKR